MNVLLVVYWFPPTNVIGSVRSYQFARYLADKGHDVRVIHASGSGFPSDYLPQMTGIGCRMVDAGRLARWLEPTKGNRRFRIVRAVARRLFFPDHHIVLRRCYLREASLLLDSGFRPDVIVSSALPFSIHSIASKLKRRTSARWIADNRDLWASSPYRRRNGFLRHLDGVYERRVLRGADLVLAIGKNMGKELAANLGAGIRVEVIRNGADVVADELPARESRAAGKPLCFVYTGTLYGGLRDVSPLLESLQADSRAAGIHFYRSEEVVLERYRASYPQVLISSHEQLSKVEVKKVQRNADFLVVALGTSDFEKGVLTGKVFEYIESRRPIIALCDEDSELALLIKNHGLGIATRDAKAIGVFITDQIRKGIPDLPLPHVSLSRRHQLGLLESHMKELVDEA